MARHREDLGERKHVRIDLHKPGFLIPAPDAPWIECTIIDVSEKGACLDVGAMAVPRIFGLAFTGGGEVLRVFTDLAPGRTARRPLRHRSRAAPGFSAGAGPDRLNAL